MGKQEKETANGSRTTRRPCIHQPHEDIKIYLQSANMTMNPAQLCL
ncbi:hypothetical protein LEMLEM_LOCUS6433 [Lemmus lemmus]